MKHYTTDYIGIIKTPFTELQGMPIQPAGAREVLGEVIVHPELTEGLRDLDGFSHIYLIYHLHKVVDTRLTVIPFMDKTPHGVFATRSPVRPSRLGLSIVELLKVEENRLTVRGADMLDGSPLIDIKPYIAAFDCPANASSGWMTATRGEVGNKRSDDRFVGKKALREKP
ncbi:MAG: tRNA (N6-threonylcarbamoyladenosine(37)-N6)-methyltransferase TrmO [Syntrophomonadaceae bacterium]|nr:tRNA (N6-threonylcarbamoyladenosine(37)-N6)-methyltransferase TrmO [Syntrophomonadaceae bacterium]